MALSSSNSSGVSGVSHLVQSKEVNSCCDDSVCLSVHLPTMHLLVKVEDVHVNCLELFKPGWDGTLAVGNLVPLFRYKLALNV